MFGKDLVAVDGDDIVITVINCDDRFAANDANNPLVVNDVAVWLLDNVVVVVSVPVADIVLVTINVFVVVVIVVENVIIVDAVDVVVTGNDGESDDNNDENGIGSIACP